MYSAETQAKIALWRAKIEDGTITIDEMKEAVAALREGRQLAAASVSAAKSRTKKAATQAATPSADSLLGELEGL